MTEQEQIEQLSVHILRRYFENLDIEPLLSSLAEDIVWLGAGKDMYRSGIDAVTAAFRQGIETMHPCVLSSLQITTQRLSPILWLCQICSDIAPRPETQISLQEHQRCAFIFRRTGTSENDTGWELVYLNNSMAYQPLRKKSFFATEQGIRNYELLHHVDISHLSTPDKQALFALLERSAYRPLDADTQELFLILSQFQYFSETQAMYMWRRLDAKDMLLREEKRHAFLYRDSRTQEYYFNPVYAEYLRTHFSRQPRSWQRKYRQQACQWFLTNGRYEEAIRWALFLGDADSLLTAAEKGGLKALFSLSSNLTQRLWRLCRTPDRPERICGSLLIFLHYCLTCENHHGDSYIPAFEQYIAAITEPTLKHKAVSLLGQIKTVCAYPKMPATPSLLPPTYWSPTLLGIYHLTPGFLDQERHTLKDSFQAPVPSAMPSDSLWAQFLQGEYAYMTGHVDQAKDSFFSFTTASEETRHIAVYLSALLYGARLSIYYANPDILAEYNAKLHTLALTTRSAFPIALLTLGEAYMTALTSTDQGKLIAAQQRVENLQVYTLCRPTKAVVYDSLSLARHDYAKVILDGHEHLRQYTEQKLGMIYEYILIAAAYEQNHFPSEAAQALEKAIVLARPDRLVMPFAEYAISLGQTIECLQYMPAYQEFLQQVQEISMAPALERLRQYEHPKASKPRPAILTPREQQIAHLVSDGKTNKDIAKTLHIAEITVKKTLSKVYQKLGVANRAGLTQYISTRHLHR